MRINFVFAAVSSASLASQLVAAFQTSGPLSRLGNNLSCHSTLSGRVATISPIKGNQMSRLRFSNSDTSAEHEKQTLSFPTYFSWLMLGLPFASVIFPQILEIARSFTPNSPEQFAVVTALFVGNRAYLYALSATILGLAALRGATDSPRLGQRITDLTEELLYRPPLSQEKPRLENEEKPIIIQNLANSGIGESLDQVSTESQALILPVLVSALLAISVFLLPIWNGASNINVDNTAFLSNAQDFISQWLPKISQAWNVGLLALFTRSEVRRLGFELEVAAVDSTLVEWIFAIGITSLAFFSQIWPAQNFVNMSLAILVARAIQLDKFPAVIAALSLLTIYDATSVFLIPAANAVMDDMASSQNPFIIADASPATSAMGSVAVQKLTSGSFQPGLLVTKIGDRLGGGLGLGDAVFPSLLVNFVRRFDLDKSSQSGEERLPLFAVSMGGYLFGCFACELVPMISTSGLPALVFIIPSMVGSVLLASSVSGELADLWSFDPQGRARGNKG